MAIIADGQVRMAYLAIVGSHSVNGVAALHTEILKKQELKNFYDEAYFMVRINEGTPGEVSGGKLTHLTGNLYLLQAKEPTVTIEKLED